ncbi:hypothetical protein L226DRAFT_243225 [Lentinus tigrinus ALCF2SS1-7]|uniref:uncharacterized protein n=1 Tax=Lentinus tigrinus ALCF2SS1-7 TaxID=1328758 RepID=UPI0011661197|nr:hypothetical protein L226DRAFT_243225 [Lentinus tigrinus ALCF2SS1-7]
MDLVPASATSAVSNREPQPGLVIQYKSARARAFTTVQGEEVMGSFRLRVAHELLADLHALFLEIPGVSMQDMTIVWKSGLVRVTFGIYGKEFCEMVKFMVNRASAQFAHIMSSRSIANIQYIEATPLSTCQPPYGVPKPPTYFRCYRKVLWRLHPLTGRGLG